MSKSVQTQRILHKNYRHPTKHTSSKNRLMHGDQCISVHEAFCLPKAIKAMCELKILRFQDISVATKLSSISSHHYSLSRLGVTVMSSVSGLYTFTIKSGSSKLTRHARTPSSGNFLFLTRISRATGCFCSNSKKTTYTTSWCPHVAMQHEVENPRTWEVELKFWTGVYFFQGAKLFVSSQQLVFGQSLKIQATFPLKSSTVSVVCWPIVKRTANLLLFSATQKSTL